MNIYQPTNVKLIIALLVISVIIIGCERTPSTSVVYVDPPEGGSIEPTLPAIIVTFDGPPENFKATRDYEISGNTVIFSGPFQLGRVYHVTFKWDSDLFKGDEGSMTLNYPVKSSAVVTITDDPNDLKLLRPWPSLANLGSGDPNVDVLRFEVPIYIDRPLAYDLPVRLDTHANFVHLTYDFRGGLYRLPYSTPSVTEDSSRCVIEEGKTETLCVIEIEAVNYTDPDVYSNLEYVKIGIGSADCEIGSPSGILKRWTLSP